MRTSVYFVRHAESDLTIKEDAIRPLTQKVFEDSKKVTITLKNKNISHIYSSPYKRTIDTVRNISETLGIEIIMIESFRERRVGEWVEDFRFYSRRQWTDFDYKLNNGESLREVQERNISALSKIVNDNQGKNIVVATHGTALSTIIKHFRYDFGFNEFWNIVDRFPYIVCIEFDGTNFIGIEEIELHEIRDATGNGNQENN